jgi:hypothetical protein
MVWLLCGLVLLGLVLLAGAAIPLLRRARKNRVELAAFRSGLDEALARVRVTQAHISEWKRARGGPGHLGPGA